MKRLLLLLSLILLVEARSDATNVSGGIFANTTWTMANSPYIVTDTVVVFPGFTLTIEPGVIVKFDQDKRLDIRQATLVAVGTAANPITFTSNLSSPAKGSWSGIYVTHGSNSMRVQQFDHCIFKYAHKAIESKYTSTNGDTFRVKNSLFQYNNSGICGWTVTGMPRVYVDSSMFMNNDCGIGSFEGNMYGTEVYFSSIKNSTFADNLEGGAVVSYSSVSNCTFNNNRKSITARGNNKIANCTVDSNIEYGVHLGPWFDTLLDCKIMYNAIGVKGTNYGGTNIVSRNIIADNGIGLHLFFGRDSVYCNAICRSATYGISYAGTTNVSNYIYNNTFCTPDSASTEPLIYHAYDNSSLGIVRFMPINNACAPTVPAPLSVEPFQEQQEVNIYPNPFSKELIIATGVQFKNAGITLSNVMGQVVKEFSNVSGQQFILPRADLQAGFYFIQVTQEGRLLANKRVVIAD